MKANSDTQARNFYHKLYVKHDSKFTNFTDIVTNHSPGSETYFHENSWNKTINIKFQIKLMKKVQKILKFQKENVSIRRFKWRNKYFCFVTIYTFKLDVFYVSRDKS